MIKYARIVDSVAVEILVPPEGFDLADCVHEAMISLFTEVPANVTANSKISGTGKWTIAPGLEPSPASITYSTVSAMTFQMLFSSQERIAIKGLTSTDTVIEDWWGIVNDPRLTEVDLNLKSVQDALEYITSIGILVEGRKTEILAAKVQ